MKYKRMFNKEKEVLDAYQSDPDYDYRSRTYKGKVTDEYQIKYIKEKIGKNKSKKILEAGCGTGRIIVPLAKSGYKDCNGFDFSKNMLKNLTKKNKDLKYKVKTKIGNIQEIPYKDNTFDVVYTMHVLMHLPYGYKKAFEEMYRVTKKGGIIVLDFPNKDSITSKVLMSLRPNMKRTNLFSKKELGKYFSKYNYKIEGLFTYPRRLYEVPVLRNIIYLLEKITPYPQKSKTQLMIIVKK